MTSRLPAIREMSNSPTPPMCAYGKINVITSSSDSCQGSIMPHDDAAMVASECFAPLGSEVVPDV
jgi:hypothetical protein